MSAGGGERGLNDRTSFTARPKILSAAKLTGNGINISNYTLRVGPAFR